MKAHFETCTTNPSEISEENTTKVLDSSNSLSKLYALEAPYISEIKPSLNTKDEYRSRALTLKIYKPLIFNVNFINVSLGVNLCSLYC